MKRVKMRRGESSWKTVVVSIHGKSFWNREMAEER
jgi:hypothetical protein